MIRMNKKGFTLIELLAIIVILAIIAVITVPIILNIIENANRGAATDSAYGFKDSIRNYYAEELIRNPSFKLGEGNYNVSNDGTSAIITNEDDSSVSYEIQLSGKLPESGVISISNGELVSGYVIIDGFKVTFENSKVVVSDDDSGSSNTDTQLWYGYWENWTTDYYSLLDDTVFFASKIGSLDYRYDGVYPDQISACIVIDNKPNCFGFNNYDEEKIFSSVRALFTGENDECEVYEYNGERELRCYNDDYNINVDNEIIELQENNDYWFVRIFFEDDGKVHFVRDQV